ncbi:hypothetical protein GCM10023219_26970 [Stakelama sediminis]|uniref:Uncharacterized protein n=1 Tax=Stakelama sediminis TaxID=463200 RepID=A0A840YYM7_9SPHN|nr:hypothetical protein [Stakelama sediminis]MBB5718622.1 hypothetical protein [Stakelama sediminis]
MKWRYVTAQASTVFALPVSAQPLLHPMFQDHAVLQRDVALTIYGSAAPYSRVTASIVGETGQATADPVQ